MAKPRTKVTKQGRISVPAEIRRRLGLVPGSVVEWDEKDGEIVVRRRAADTNTLVRVVTHDPGI